MKYLVYTVSKTKDDKYGDFRLVACFPDRAMALDCVHDLKNEMESLKTKSFWIFQNVEMKFVIVEVSNYEIL